LASLADDDGVHNSEEEGIAMPNDSLKSKCERCSQYVAVRVQLVIDDGACWRVCGHCAVADGVKARRQGFAVTLIAFSYPMVNSFCTGDGRYFAHGEEAVRQQRAYEVRADRYCERVRRVYRATLAAESQQQTARVA
jgi:hypothetical protein